MATSLNKPRVPKLSQKTFAKKDRKKEEHGFPQPLRPLLGMQACDTTKNPAL